MAYKVSLEIQFGINCATELHSDTNCTSNGTNILQYIGS